MKKIVSCSELFPEDDQDGLYTQLPSSTAKDTPPEAAEPVDPLQAEVHRLRESVLKTLVEHNKSSGPYCVPSNILLIGQASAGKSSSVNLLKSAILGHYDEIAAPGASGEGSCPQFTNRLIAYPNMGFTELEFEELKNEFLNIHFPADFRLPTIYDMPGLQNNPYFVLDCVLDGIVPEDVELVTSMSREGLPPVDLSQPAARSIDRVIFVASITQDVAIDQFSEAFQAACWKRAIPFVLLFTHVDQAALIARKEDGRRSNEEIRREDAKALLWITKNSKLLSHDIVNYCDDDPTSELDPSQYQADFQKHKDALEAFKKIIKPKKRPTWRRISGKCELMKRYLWFKISRMSEGWIVRLSLIAVALALSIYAVVYGLPSV